MPLLPELKNILGCVSTKMPPLTGLDGGDRNPKVIWTERKRRNTVADVK
jgi:hypothetical protein